MNLGRQTRQWRHLREGMHPAILARGSIKE